MKRIFLIIVPLFFLAIATRANAATLSLSPSSASHAIGDIFGIDVVLDSQGSPVDGVDVRYINYNPSLLEVQDSDPATSGVQIATGSLMPVTNINNVDTTLGKIQFSQSAIVGSSYTGNGTLATIKFKALASGTANVTIDYTSGRTTDTNIASSGGDILSGVTNGSYVISGSSSSGGTTGGGTTTGGAGGSGATSSSGTTSGTTSGGITSGGGAATSGASGGGSSAASNAPSTSGGGGGGGGGGGISNHPTPYLPSLIKQFISNGLINISEGAQINDSIVYFKATISDPESEPVKLRVELRKTTESFTGNSDGGILESNLVSSGSTVSIMRGGLDNGSYKWRYQVIDNQGVATPWQEFGLAGNTDFIIGSVSAVSANANSSAGYDFAKDLSYGMKADPDVINLQKVLSLEGLFTNDTSLMTGNFFGVTKQAVINFQIKYGISPAAGNVGPLTRAKLNQLYGGNIASAPKAAASATSTATGYNFLRNLSYGMKADPDVINLQKVLSLEGLFTNDTSLMTGNFFGVTKQAVINFQIKYGISPAAGNVGPLTRAKLNQLYGGVNPISAPTPSAAPASSADIFTRTLYLGLRGDDVRRLQDILAKDGVYDGYVGGYFGSLTKDAVLKFQNKYNISGANGVFGPKTRAKLIELYP